MNQTKEQLIDVILRKDEEKAQLIQQFDAIMTNVCNETNKADKANKEINKLYNKLAFQRLVSVILFIAFVVSFIINLV